MSLFGSNRDDRRRRNLAEELATENASSATSTPAKPAGKGERYTASGRREHRRHTSDFIPRHGFSLAAWLTSGLVIVAGLVVGYLKVGSDASGSIGLGALLDASQGGSLAGWFSSLLFILAAAGSVLVYSIRRHRTDDYRGSYRLWLWCAAAWMMMSVDATANLHTPFSTAMARMTGWSMLGGGIWWIGVWGSVLTILALRLLLEVRECRTATLGFTLVFSLWAASLATDYGWLPGSEYAALEAIGGRLVGQVMLLFSVAYYARHVLLDAEGMIKERAKRVKREKKAKAPKAAPAESKTEAKTTRVDAAHKSVPQPTGGPLASHMRQAGTQSSNKTSSESSSGAANRYSGYTDRDEDEDDRYSERRGTSNRYDDEDDEDDDSHGGNRKLSKAERKKMRKQMRRQQRDDEDE
jgi:hypothetical protein